MEIKIVLGVVATVIAFVSYVPYFRDIIRGATRPHAFSWLVWGALTAIAFIGQIVEGGGAGAWVTGFTALVSFIIFFTALFRGEKNVTTSDWLSLFGAGLALLFWFITDGPLVSVILITIIDALGFYPTFRKSWYKPSEETVSTYVLSSIKFVIAIFALESYSIVTWLYPASLVVMNGAFVVMVMYRRNKKIQKVYKALLIPVNSRKEILIQDRRNYKKPDWGLFGGSVEEGETPEQAVIREAKEELDLSLTADEIIYTGESDTEYNGKMVVRHIFVYKTDQEKFVDEEGDGAYWCTHDEAREKLDIATRFDDLLHKIDTHI